MENKALQATALITKKKDRFIFASIGFMLNESRAIYASSDRPPICSLGKVLPFFFFVFC
jgi:hypothetical protein